jgi:hypothetical protein
VARDPQVEVNRSKVYVVMSPSSWCNQVHNFSFIQ